MKNKTAMQQLIEEMQRLGATNSPVYDRAKELLEEERKQIEAAYIDGAIDGGNSEIGYDREFRNSIDYYQQTYGGEE